MNEIAKQVGAAVIGSGGAREHGAFVKRLAADTALSKSIMTQARERKRADIALLAWIIDFVKRLLELIFRLVDGKLSANANAESRQAAEKFYEQHKDQLDVMAHAATAPRLRLPSIPSLSMASPSAGRAPRGSKEQSGQRQHKPDSRKPAGFNRKGTDDYRTLEQDATAADDDKDGPPDTLDRSNASVTEGVLLRHGQAYYQFEMPLPEEARYKEMNYYVQLRLANGKEVTCWGKELAPVMKKANLELGAEIRLRLLGRSRVIKQIRTKNPDGTRGDTFTNKEVERNEWKVELLGAEAAQSPRKRRAPR